MKTWGISANSHDASIAVFDNKELVYASHSERYSKIKNDGDLSHSMISELLENYGAPDKIVWYEKPLLKSFRQWYAGQGFNIIENYIPGYLKAFNLDSKIEYSGHHRSHAAAGYFTSTFDNACVVVIDAIGEFDTLTIWEANGNTLKQRYSMRYPNSIGLWYSAMTQRIGLKPNEEEYILMGRAALGNPERFFINIMQEFIELTADGLFTFKKNLHKGCKDWRPELTTKKDFDDIAAATQAVYEHLFKLVLKKAKALVSSSNLVLMGGCALNCVANSHSFKYFNNVWIMPNPGDAGSSVGAVLSSWNEHISWPGAYLGHDMGYSDFNDDIATYIEQNSFVGLARGKAEFGPRALGNRSLLGDPRLYDIKDRMNVVKRREQFRPFAPAVLAEHASEIFDMPCETVPYMQYTVKCKYPEKYPGIVHIDGTSRVQTVTENENPMFRRLLETWYKKTGCPMLVNTSLNIKGEPIVNTHADADRWQLKYQVKVFR